MTEAAPPRPSPRVAIHLGPGLRRLVSPDEVFFLEATGDDTLVRLHGSKKLRDTRPLGELHRFFEPHGFVRIHSGWSVALTRILECRKRDESDLWEVRVEPPVNRILPVSREGWRRLREVLGEA